MNKREIIGELRANLEKKGKGCLDLPFELFGKLSIDTQQKYINYFREKISEVLMGKLSDSAKVQLDQRHTNFEDPKRYKWILDSQFEGIPVSVDVGLLPSDKYEKAELMNLLEVCSIQISYFYDREKTEGLFENVKQDGCWQVKVVYAETEDMDVLYETGLFSEITERVLIKSNENIERLFNYAPNIRSLSVFNSDYAEDDLCLVSEFGEKLEDLYMELGSPSEKTIYELAKYVEGPSITNLELFTIFATKNREEIKDIFRMSSSNFEGEIILLPKSMENYPVGK